MDAVDGADVQAPPQLELHWMSLRAHSQPTYVLRLVSNGHTTLTCSYYCFMEATQKCHLKKQAQQLD